MADKKLQKTVHPHCQSILRIVDRAKADSNASHDKRLAAAIIQSICKQHPDLDRDAIFKKLDAFLGAVKELRVEIRRQVRT